MKFGDLLTTQGLSPGKSDLLGNRMEIFELMQRMELFESGMDGLCVFKP